MIPGIAVGTKATVQKLVTEADTALHFGSRTLTTILATPVLVALMTEAAAKAADPLLPDGIITIGRSLSITHEKPTPIGMTVTVTAVVSSVDGNRIMFDVTAYDETGQIGYGSFERFIVNRQKILDQAENRKIEMFA